MITIIVAIVIAWIIIRCLQYVGGWIAFLVSVVLDMEWTGTRLRPKVEQPPSHTLVLALILGGLVIAYFVLGYLVKR